MTREELLQLISDVQARKSELDSVEVKAAKHDTPKRLFESLSALANRPGGGVILFGLDEETDFSIVGVADASKLQTDLTGLANDSMEPPLRPQLTVEIIDAKTIVAAEVIEIPNTEKPCFYKTRGLQSGSYLRVGNSNRRMTDYEIFGYISNRQQPALDEDPVNSAFQDDLDKGKLQEFISQLRRSSPNAGYLKQPGDEILVQRRIIREVGGSLRPTLSGLLMFGSYPQQFEPQLVITFLQYYGTSEDELTPRGERFLDNRKFEGAIPEMIESAINHIMASIRKSRLIEGLWARDIPEYPEVALREAILNAVGHRDYSSFVRGSYIQIRLFADRIEIQSPGGLYGNVSEENLEEEQSTRNRTLMQLMEDYRLPGDRRLLENRGSGIRAMLEAMRGANLEPPRFQDKRSSFWVTFKNHSLMSPDAIEWLNQFSGYSLSDFQRVALAYLRLNKEVTNGEYQRLNRVDSVSANRDLRGLVQAGLIEQQGTKRGAYYRLSPSGQVILPEIRSDQELAVMRHIVKHRSISRSECATLLRISLIQARYVLAKMQKSGLIRLIGQKRGSKYVSSGK